MSKFTDDLDEREDARPHQKTYEELKREAEQRWTEIGQIREAKLRELRIQIQQMPDEQARPDPTVPWSHSGIVCAGCKNDQFFIERWVTVNGVRHRFLATCTKCKDQDVYDWGLNAWLPR